MPSNPNAPTTPVRLTAADVQQRLRIGPRTLYSMVAGGRFPPPDLVVGQRRLWTLEHVEVWERAHRPA